MQIQPLPSIPTSTFRTYQTCVNIFKFVFSQKKKWLLIFPLTAFSIQIYILPHQGEGEGEGGEGERGEGEEEGEEEGEGSEGGEGGEGERGMDGWMNE